jgi:hypothetical protein
MPTKARQQLLQALQQRATPAPKDAPPGLSLPPLSATCWAAASWEEVCCADGGGRPAGGRGKKGQEGVSAYHGFDLCIGDFTVYEGVCGGACCAGACCAWRLSVCLSTAPRTRVTHVAPPPTTHR